MKPAYAGEQVSETNWHRLSLRDTSDISSQGVALLETKADVLREICNLVSISEYSTTSGSSVPRRFFSDLLDTFGIEDEGDSVTASKKLFEVSNSEWKPGFASENTPSGGGGTITLEGLKALRNVVIQLLDDIEASQFDNKGQVDAATPEQWSLLRGQSILRTKLHDRYSGIRQGGIAPSKKTKNIFLFTDDSSNNEHGYERDYWLDDMTFLYCGDGQIGNQEMTRRNLQVLNHIKDERKLRLFSPVSGKVTYLGELRIDDTKPFELVDGIGRDGNSRKVIMFRLKRVVESHENSDEDYNEGDSEGTFGKNYIFANEDSREVEESEPFTSDPNLLDRALQIHSLTQNTVANWIIGEGLLPLSPNSQLCDFDIAWVSDFGKIVCEVKSLSETNEVHQFRFGLGQVLEYAEKLEASPVLMFNRKPSQQELIKAANRAGVAVLWPELLNNYSPKDLRILRQI
jgi:hypothetical protein